MGDDTPMPVLSKQSRSLYDYFRQQFAQVTNPPIDSLRETSVMSLETCLGVERNLFDESSLHAGRLILDSPVLSNQVFKKLITYKKKGFSNDILSLHYDKNIDLEEAIAKYENAREAIQQRISELGTLKNKFLFAAKILFKYCNMEIYETQ